MRTLVLSIQSESTVGSDPAASWFNNQGLISSQHNYLESNVAVSSIYLGLLPFTAVLIFLK